MTSLNHSIRLFRCSSTASSSYPTAIYNSVPAIISYTPRLPASSSYVRSISEIHSSAAAPTFKTVKIPYKELKDPGADILDKIELGFGCNGLGILSVSDVPGYALLRRNLLHLAPRLAKLPEGVKEELEDPHSRYNIGWSHGKEKLESGKPDMLKGSFYANPILDIPTTELSLVKRYPSYCGPNKWPLGALPELELAFKALGKLILDVGLLLAYHCDRYTSNSFKMDEGSSLQEMLLRSRCHKGRLLYYFPVHECNFTEDNEATSSWCGWHTDHGSLTGLTCGMFTRDGGELPCRDNAAGLYVKTRSGQIVKVVYGEEEIAYQIGETTEIMSRGQLCATPHCVQAPKGKTTSGIERSTFALFMQPDWNERLNFPQALNLHEFIVPNASISFGEYTEKVLDKYYDQKA